MHMSGKMFIILVLFDEMECVKNLSIQKYSEKIPFKFCLVELMNEVKKSNLGISNPRD